MFSFSYKKEEKCEVEFSVFFGLSFPLGSDLRTQTLENSEVYIRLCMIYFETCTNRKRLNLDYDLTRTQQV